MKKVLLMALVSVNAFGMSSMQKIKDVLFVMPLWVRHCEEHAPTCCSMPFRCDKFEQPNILPDSVDLVQKIQTTEGEKLIEKLGMIVLHYGLTHYVNSEQLFFTRKERVWLEEEVFPFLPPENVALIKKVSSFDLSSESESSIASAKPARRRIKVRKKKLQSNSEKAPLLVDYEGL